MNSLTTFSTANYKTVSYEQALQVLVDNPWHTARDKRRLRRHIIQDIRAKIKQIADAYNNHPGPYGCKEWEAYQWKTVCDLATLGGSTEVAGRNWLHEFRSLQLR